MFTIRKQQMLALREAAVDAFIRGAVKNLQQRLPKRCAGRTDAQLFALLKSSVPKAESFGIDDSEDLIPFFDLVIAHGVNFEKAPKLLWTQQLLGSAALSGSVKMAIIHERLPKALRP